MYTDVLFSNIAAKRDWHPIGGGDFLNISFVESTEDQLLRGHCQPPLRIKVVPLQPDIPKSDWDNGEIQFSMESIVRQVYLSKRWMKSGNRP